MARRPDPWARPARCLAAALAAWLVAPGCPLAGQRGAPGEEEAPGPRITISGELRPDPRRVTLPTPRPDCPPEPQR